MFKYFFLQLVQRIANNAIDSIDISVIDVNKDVSFATAAIVRACVVCLNQRKRMYPTSISTKTNHLKQKIYQDTQLKAVFTTTNHE